ncbi:MAG TPA: MFS transporter, partial [Nocardioides sp.]|nr:MFS transporter [Nocardioides sp.]
MFKTQTSRAPRVPDQRSTGSRLVMTAMILAVSMTFIDQTIVAIASPTLQGDLHLNASQGQWVITAYLVALAATFALGGRLADVWGRRRMLLIGIVGFAATSALCGATPDSGWAEAWLIGARAGQGVFAAVLMPAAIAIVYSSAPAAKRGRSLAMFFGMTGAFTALGPILGDYLLNYSWRAIFWVNLPVAAAAVVVALAARIPETRRPARIDWRGAVLVAAGMALSVLGFSQSATWGWDSTGTWSCLVGGALLLAVFVVVELRTAEPLVRLSIFRARGFRVDSGVLFLAMVGFVPVSYFLSMYAHISLGMDATEATHLLLMFFIGYFVAA